MHRNIPKPQELNPSEMEEFCNEAYVRELASQLIALLPRWQRIRWLIRHPRYFLRFCLRSRVRAPQLGASPDTPERPNETTASHEAHISTTLYHCLMLEVQLRACVAARTLVQLRDRIAEACERARWREFEVQLMAQRPLLSRVELLFRSGLLPAYLMRVRKVETSLAPLKLPVSALLGLQSDSQN